MAMYWGTSRWSAMEIMVNARLAFFTNLMLSANGLNFDC